MKVNGPPPRPRSAFDAGSTRSHRPPAPSPVKPTAGASCPDWLTKAAAAEWRRLQPELERLGLLTVVDLGLLASWCEAWSLFRQATEELKEHGPFTEAGNGTPIQHPAVAAQASAAERMRKLAPNFGFSPADRMRLLVGNTEDDDQQRKDAQYFGPRPAPAPPKAS